MAISRANIGKEIKMAPSKKKLNIKKGKIPMSKLNAAAKKKGKLGQRARFAKTLKKLNRRKA